MHLLGPAWALLKYVLQTIFSGPVLPEKFHASTQVPSISMYTLRLLSPHPHAYLTTTGRSHSRPPVFPEIFSFAG